MPLIILTGLPCSGKTHRAQQLRSEFTRRLQSSDSPSTSRLRVIHLPSHHASSDAELSSSSSRETIYTSASAEKTARAEEFSAIKRALSRDTVVIADGANYIKGYRYQLWCEAKAAGTRCCVVHVAAREEECVRWNRARLRAWGRGGEADEDEEKEKTIEGSVGDLVPESHTAIYGDKVVRSVSRSSSTHGLNDGDAHEGISPPPRQLGVLDDSMTLQSLSLRDNDMTAAKTELLADIPLNDQSMATDRFPTPPEPPPPSASPPYKPSTLLSLAMRYEPPSPFSRWDTPLFTLPTSDPYPPYDSIWTALFPTPTKPSSKKALAQRQGQRKGEGEGDGEGDENKPEPVRQHAATVLPAANPATALQDLEAGTASVVTALLAAYKSAVALNPDQPAERLTFTVPSQAAKAEGSDEVEVEFELTLPPHGTPLSQPLLQRLRRKYTQLQRGGIAHGVGHVGEEGRGAVVEGFVRFLGVELG